MVTNEKTLGSICAGIGGFDIGFERAGWRTAWQIELDDINRAVLADRFPHAERFKNLNDWRSYRLPQVACISFGFPCQDISDLGNSKHNQSNRGLAGSRSGLFFEIMEIVREIQPAWLVIENVPALLHVNDCEDFQVVIQTLAQCGYVGYARVLNAQYFGVATNRRRLVLVAGLRRYPSADFLADSAPVEAIFSAAGTQWLARAADDWAGPTLTSPDKYKFQYSRISKGCELLIAEENGWHQMAERGREVELHGLRAGLDASNIEEAYAAGNAFPPPMAEWIAGILNRS